MDTLTKNKLNHFILLSLLVSCVGFGVYHEKQVANKNIHNESTYEYWAYTYAETAPLIDKIIFTKTNDTFKVRAICKTWLEI